MTRSWPSFKIKDDKNTRFVIFRRHFQPGYEIVCENTGESYFARMSFRRLLLHDGDKKAPVIAQAYIPQFASSICIGMGDTDQTSKIEWESIQKLGFGRLGFWNTDPLGWEKLPGPTNLVWKHTRTMTSEIQLSLLGGHDFKLQNLDNNELFAVFTRWRSSHTGGTLQIDDRYGQEFEMRVLMACLAQQEAARIRHHHITYKMLI